MTESTEIHIPFKDLTKVVIECSTCQAEITVDISKGEHRAMASQQQKKCSVCGHPLDSKFSEAFTYIFQWYDSLKDTSFADKIYFRVKKSAGGQA